MKNLKWIIAATMLAAFTITTNAQTSSQKGVKVNNSGASVKSTSGSGVAVKKGEATVTNSHGGGSKIDKTGAAAKNKNGAGVEAKKGEVSAKNSHGSGVGVDKKGLEVKGSKGGMKVEKGKFEIKGKNTNIHIGK
jgi:hypothetical protein